MTVITREWLQKTIAEFECTRDDIPFGLDEDDDKILTVLKQALATREDGPTVFDPRRDFEYWMLRTHGPTCDFTRVRFIDGMDYADHYMRHMWKTWRARQAALLQDKPANHACGLSAPSHLGA
ncbi:hypothetical protein PHA77_01840 [Edwardsiella tarda]|uniref:hypothetical protein n=1 Tax=Edwardsiella tarda TaxID=636 RepID=UPI002444CE6C|nr:hypothetical protein [Edwardsiella tarda]WGE29434.1 hypothetical protein PHA77_01840 [Edwardsiella tarda]